MDTTLKNKTMLIATGNAHKIQEIQSILSPIHVKAHFKTHFITPDDIHISPSIEEDGNSFLENALLKARAYHSIASSAVNDLVILAEDSGLCIEALNGRPHIHSARYEIEAFETQTNTMSLSRFQCEKILEEMEGQHNRNAHFVCCAVLLWHNAHHTEEYIVCEKKWHGEIISDFISALIPALTSAPEKKTGKQPVKQALNGFGYDPIFYVPALQRTAAELSPHEKNAHSHRAQAITTLASHIY